METKVAIVTGASRGIGKAIAEEFASKGYSLGLISKDKSEIEKVCLEIGDKYGVDYSGIDCDVRDKERVLDVFCRFSEDLGGLDVLVNNAGVNKRKNLNFENVEKWFDDFEDRSWGWDEEIGVNLTGVYNCSYVGAGLMMVNGGGSIVNISSIKGKEATSSPGYGASKAGVIKLTRDFAKSLAGEGIRVNCVAPGFIDTGMTAELSEEKKEDYKGMIPLGRFGGVTEIAKVVGRICNDDFNYVTGETINVNGGYLMD